MRKKTLFRHILKPFNVLFYSVLAGAILFIFILFNTEFGLRLSIKAAEKISKGTLLFQGPSGTLSQKIHFKKISLKKPGETIQVEDVLIEWNPLALLEWHLHFHTLKIRNISIIKNPSQTQKILDKAQKPSFSIPQLPIYLIVKNMDIGSISVISEGRMIYQSKALKGNITLTRTRFSGYLNNTFTTPFLARTRFEVSGDKNNYSFQLTLTGKSFNWNLVGQGDQTHLVFNTTQDQLFQGKLNLTGWIKAPLPTISVQPSSTLSPKPLNTEEKPKEESLLRWKFSLIASQVNLEQFFPFLLNGKLEGEGENHEGKLTLSLSKSFYQKNALEGEAMLQFDYPAIKTFNGEFKSGKNLLSIHGTLEDEWKVGWQAHLNELAALIPDLKGNLFSEGKITGELDKPHIQASLIANNLQSDTLSIQSIKAQAAFDMNSLKDSHIEIDAEHLKNGIFETSHLSFSGNIKNTQKGYLLSLNLQPGIFQYPLESSIKKETFNGGFWNTLFAKDKINSHFEFFLMGNSHFKGQALLPYPIRRGSNQKIQASLQGEIKNLSFLSALTSPSVRNIHGELNAQIQVNGTVKKPEIKSFLLLKGDAFLPVYNLHLKDIQLTAQGEEQTVISGGKAPSEDTTLNLTGKTSFLPREVISQFRIDSHDFLLTHTPEIKIHIAPHVRIESRNGKTTITGTINIPRADIKPLDFTNIITMPDDVRYIGEEGKKPSGPAFPVETDLLLTFGDHTYFEHQGLTGYLRGEIKIKSRPMQPTVALGRIKIREGIYQIKGRKLTIHQGYLNYNGGPINNPSLQIQATRNIQVNNIGGLDSNMDFGISEMLVGVNLTGTLRRHHVKLFSEPSGLSQANILSYLITGQSAQAGASAYLPLLLEAANSLGGSTSNSFSEEIKKGFGITDITLTHIKYRKQDALNKDREIQKDTPTIVFGKALSPVFYISYAVNLIQPISGFQARYQLTKHWILQISGIPGDKGASVDLIRSIESKD